VRLSLRAQLSLGLGLAMLVVVFVVTFVAEEIAVRNIERAIDEALQKRAHAVAAIVSLDITKEEESYARVVSDLADRQLPFLPLLLRVVSPDGEVIRQFARASDWIVESMDQQLGLPIGVDGRFDTIRGLEPLRIYVMAIPDTGTGQALAYVQAVETLSPVDDAKRLLWLNSVVVGLVGSLLAVAAGLVLMWRGFLPLREIVQAVNKVDYDHLGVRLPEETRPTELRQLAGSLMAMGRRLDTAVSEKKRFIGSVSHDLRTPLTALQGQIEVLLLQPSLSAEAKSSLERMLSETRRLILMAQNLLLNVQLESGPTLVSREVSLKELFDEVIGDVWVLAQGLELNVAAAEDVVVDGDRDLLKEMLLNIVDNAIKFTPKGGQVEFSLTSGDGWAVLGVSDTGRGIPRDQLPHVMEPFYASNKSAGEGARLGLAIVKQIAALHGGHVDIQTREGVGTTVRVRLPLRGSRARPGDDRPPAGGVAPTGAGP